jgi:hypothetical protein
MGGVGSSGNLADGMIDKQRRYTSIVLPFGLFQVLSDRNVFDPNSPQFDPIRAVEHLSSPIHYVVGRDTTTSTEALFVSDIRNATFRATLTPVDRTFVNCASRTLPRRKRDDAHFQ